MAEIDYIIPQQAYEIIREQIAKIVAVEFQNQLNLRGVLGVNFKTFVDRFAKIDIIDTPCVNVSFDRADYDKNDPSSSQGTFIYNLDFYIAASSSGGLRADTYAAMTVQTALGWLRAIFQDSRYIRLGFPPGLIGSRAVKSIQIAAPEQAIDAQTLTMGRLILEVSATETNGGISQFVLLKDNFTKALLFDTKQGYFWINESS